MKRALAWLFSFTVILSALGCISPLSVSADTSEEKAVSRMINVVYDDSNSMLLDSRLWWCYAKYSLEVFSAMMQDNDIMNIYFMSDYMDGKTPGPRLANLSGDRSQQQKNINSIHNNVTRTRGTPFSSIKNAYADLKKTSGYDEKWLVVITDGDTFDGGENSSSLDREFSDCSSNNINVVYLAIGNAVVPTENTSKGIYVYKADGNVSSGETGILSRVTQICQRIFQRPALTSASSSKLVLDVPVSEIIVFAQGENVNIGELSGARKIQSKVEMKESDKDKATTNEQYKNNINISVLNASMATFTPQSGAYIAEGTYDLNISADEYVVYYKPCLDVLIELMDSKGNKVSDKYIPIGSYSIQYWLTYPQGHPKHGQKIDQSLFDVDYTLTCDVEGSVRELNSLNVDLSEGETTIKVLAKYLTFSSSDAALKYVVEDFTINELEVSIEYLQQDYRLSTLESDNQGILVKVSKGGQPIPAAEWEAYKLAVSVDNPEFKTVKNGDSSFTIYPQYKNGEKTATATGDIEFNITVSAANDHRTTDSGTVAAKINIYDDVNAVPIGITIEDQQNDVDNKNFTTQNTDRKVTVDWNGQLLTPEQYEALKLYVDVDDKYYTATITLDPYVPGEPTTATVHFEIVPNEDGTLPKLSKLDGKKDFTVTAEIENEGQRSEGRAESVLKIDDARSFWEIWKWWIIIIALILFILLGWIFCKKWLPLKKLYYTYGSEDEEDQVKEPLNHYATANWATVLCPFVPVQSKLNLANAGNGLNIKVTALGGNRVKIGNADDLVDTDQNKMRINKSEVYNGMRITLGQSNITDSEGSFIAIV